MNEKSELNKVLERRIEQERQMVRLKIAIELKEIADKLISLEGKEE